MNISGLALCIEHSSKVPGPFSSRIGMLLHSSVVNALEISSHMSPVLTTSPSIALPFLLDMGEIRRVEEDQTEKKKAKEHGVGRKGQDGTSV